MSDFFMKLWRDEAVIKYRDAGHYRGIRGTDEEISDYQNTHAIYICVTVIKVFDKFRL